MNEKIVVVGIDFSEGSRVVLQKAVTIAELKGARLKVIHIVDLEFFDLELLENLVSVEDLRKRASKALADFCSAILNDPTVCDREVYTGHPFYELLYHAQRLHADLVVLGSDGANGNSERVGIITVRFIRKANFPVLLVREGKTTPFVKIVACCDFSETSKRAVHEAAQISSAKGVRLQVVHIHVPYEAEVMRMYGEVPMLSEGFHRVHVTELEQKMDRFLDPVRKEFPSLEIAPTIKRGVSAATGVCEFLKEQDADLVVLGTRGRTGSESDLLGTTAERVIHRSDCSVLTVDPALSPDEA